MNVASLSHISSFVGVGGFSVSSFSISGSFLIFSWNSTSSSDLSNVVMLLLPLLLLAPLLLRMFVLMLLLLLLSHHVIVCGVSCSFSLVRSCLIL
jgi:hypothetical protein